RTLRRGGHIDRSSWEATSPLGPALYVCHPRLVTGYHRLMSEASYLKTQPGNRRSPAIRWPRGRLAAPRQTAFTRIVRHRKEGDTLLRPSRARLEGACPLSWPAGGDREHRSPP